MKYVVMILLILIPSQALAITAPQRTIAEILYGNEEAERQTIAIHRMFAESYVRELIEIRFFSKNNVRLIAVSMDENYIPATCILESDGVSTPMAIDLRLMNERTIKELIEKRAERERVVRSENESVYEGILNAPHPDRKLINAMYTLVCAIARCVQNDESWEVIDTYVSSFYRCIEEVQDFNLRIRLRIELYAPAAYIVGMVKNGYDREVIDAQVIRVINAYMRYDSVHYDKDRHRVGKPLEQKLKEHRKVELDWNTKIMIAETCIEYFTDHFKQYCDYVAQTRGRNGRNYGFNVQEQSRMMFVVIKNCPMRQIKAELEHTYGLAICMEELHGLDKYKDNTMSLMRDRARIYSQVIDEISSIRGMLKRMDYIVQSQYMLIDMENEKANALKIIRRAV